MDFSFFTVNDKDDELLGLRYLFMTYDVKVEDLDHEADIVGAFVVTPLEDGEELPEDFLSLSDEDLEVFLRDESRTHFIIVSHTKEMYYLVQYKNGKAKRVALTSEELKELFVENDVEQRILPPPEDILEKLWKNTIN